MEKISDLFGGQNSTTKAIKIMLQGAVDNIPPIGEIKPWMSDDDIPEGWDNLGAQTPEEAKQGTRFYSIEKYPEFRDFMSRTGNSYMANGSLPVLSTGEVLRQVVKNGCNDPSYAKDFTKPWDWQGDAIREVVGNLDWMASGSGVAGGAFGQVSEGSKTWASAIADDSRYDYVYDFKISRVHPVAKDVRMTNRSVNFIIKVKHTKGQQDMIDALNNL